MPQLMAAQSIDQHVYIIQPWKHPGATHRRHYPGTASFLQLSWTDWLVTGYLIKKCPKNFESEAHPTKIERIH
jgi:hypothetical protein